VSDTCPHRGFCDAGNFDETFTRRANHGISSLMHFIADAGMSWSTNYVVGFKKNNRADQ
jgi:hypothetical protein